MSGEGATVDASEGLMTPGSVEGAARRPMIRNSRWVVLFADHTKVGEVHLARLAEIGDINALVTDGDLGAAREFEDAGLEVVRA